LIEYKYFQRYSQDCKPYIWPLSPMDKVLDKIPVTLVSLLLASLPFSIAANSVLLAALAAWMLFEMLRSPDMRKNLKGAGHPIPWAVIPLIYGISILYSHDYHRALNQWLNLSPLFVMPLAFLTFRLDQNISRFRVISGLALCVSIVIHILVNAGLFDLGSKEAAMGSFFHDREKNAWIFWAGFLSWLGGQEHKIMNRFFQSALFLGLLYFGNLTLILLAAFCWLAAESTFTGRGFKLAGPGILIFGGSMVMFALVFFPSFSMALQEAGQNILALAGRTSVSPGLQEYFIHLKMGFLQWWTHPFAGTGIGDYIHAMWNEYHDHGMEAPNYPHSQWVHLLVSTGMMAFGAGWILIRSWKPLTGTQRLILALVLTSFLFMAPLKSQISATALMMAVLLIPGYGRNQA